MPWQVEAELDLPAAKVQLVLVHHLVPSRHDFRADGLYWVELCLTPRRPKSVARYADRWGPHRFAEMGSILAFPPGETMDVKSSPGRRASVICQVKSAAVSKWLPRDFAWTDRQLEACLHITNDQIRWLLLGLNRELRSPGRGSRDMCSALVASLSIELARHIQSVNEPVEKGGLASWRLRVVDDRFAEPGEPPTLTELAGLCSMSVRQLTRGFRTSRGCSIGDHIAQARIEAAKRKLASDESIKAIAWSLGYTTQSAFTFAFRRATGTTPDQYRKRADSGRRLAARESRRDDNAGRRSS